MKALVWHATGDIRLDDVAEPQIEQPTDAVIRLTASAICGTDLHFIRGTFSDMKAGTILGHEGVGIIEQLGDQCVILMSAIGWWFARRSLVATALPVAAVTPRSVIMPIRTAHRPVPVSLAARKRPVLSTAYRQKRRVYPLPLIHW